MGSLRNQLTAKKTDLKNYNANLATIELNIKIDSDISLVKTYITVAQTSKDSTMIKIEKISNEIIQHETAIDTKTKLIEQIKKEAEIEKVFKVYIDMVGKKGISKLVLRSALPIINTELKRLMDGVCDFEVEIFMDDKNEVKYLIWRDGVSKLLKSGSGYESTASAIAVRCVMGKVSTLPMPNFITFDEVLGRVAPINIELMKPLFDKIKDMYDIVFLITHNDLVKDWADKIVTVVKENNTSRVTIR
jgi:DNA repair exonuclease SbcCD ATPase subunit